MNERQKKVPFKDFEYFSFAKQVLSETVRELLMLKLSNSSSSHLLPSSAQVDLADDRARLLVAELKQHSLALFDWEHGGKLCEYLFDLYGFDIWDVLRNANPHDLLDEDGSLNTKSVEMELYSRVDLFQVAARYKAWLVSGGATTAAAAKPLVAAASGSSSDLESYQVSSSRFDQWVWENIQRPLLHNKHLMVYERSPLRE